MADEIVSIVVPVYKAPAALLERFLRSAQRQTFSNLELIAVDDASPDHCPAMLDAAAANDPRMRVIHRSENGRAGMARNDGLACAKGQYIVFADADDIMRPDMCETLFGLASKHDANIVACSWDIRDPEGRLLGRGRLPERKYDLQCPKQKARAYERLNYALWNKMFRRDAIADLRFEQFEANIGEDTLFNVMALARGQLSMTTTYCGYDYTVYDGSATGRTAKSMPYLKTLAASSQRIREVLAETDGSIVAARFADHLSLNRFTTGCGWIAGNPDLAERAALWRYWREYLRADLLPILSSHAFLAVWYKLAGAMSNPALAYCLTRIAFKIADPHSLVDKLEARGSIRRRHSFSSRVR